MAYNTNFDDESKDPVYDLRQVYAVELVGEALKDIARARKSNNFSVYFDCLNDLYIIIKHKFKINKDNNPVKNYNHLVNEAIKEANKYPNDWLGTSKTPLGCSAIKIKLNAIEMFLYDQMERSKMFGSNKFIAGL